MTLEFVGLFGMVSQMFIKFAAPHLFRSHIWIFCFLRILCRFFGLCSGCIAFLMAIERYFALTKPFHYCKHFTNRLVKRLIFILCTVAGVLSFAPVLGFGIFIDEEEKNCARYRDAKEPADVAYAFLIFFAGKFATRQPSSR
jgi:prostaglandin E receptor 4